MPKSCSVSDVSAKIWHATTSGHTRMSYMRTRTECNRGRVFNTRKSVQWPIAEWTFVWCITMVMDWRFIDTEGQLFNASKLPIRLIWTSEGSLKERDRSQSNKFNSSMRSGHMIGDWGRSGDMALRSKRIVRIRDWVRMVVDRDASNTSTWVMYASSTDNWRKSLKAHGSVYHRWDRPSLS